MESIRISGRDRKARTEPIRRVGSPRPTEGVYSGSLYEADIPGSMAAYGKERRDEEHEEEQ